MHDHLFAAHAYTQGMSCARPAKVFKLLPHFPANCLQPTIDDTLHFQTGYFALDNYHNSDFPRFQASLPQFWKNYHQPTNVFHKFALVHFSWSVFPIK